MADTRKGRHKAYSTHSRNYFGASKNDFAALIVIQTPVRHTHESESSTFSKLNSTKDHHMNSVVTRASNTRHTTMLGQCTDGAEYCTISTYPAGGLTADIYLRSGSAAAGGLTADKPAG